MQPLNRKLLRELWRLRGQVLAVALVIASGVGVLIMSLSAYQSLQETTYAYYQRYRFGDVFARLERAPKRLAERVSAIPGVQTVQTRISKFATLDIDGFAEPAVGQLVSIPERGEPLLNRLALRAGRFVAPGQPDEVVLNEPFAEAHDLAPGDTLKAIINGRLRTLSVVGVALSPEFVYALGPGTLIPDDQRFGIMWLGREALAAAYDLDGAFNDLSLSLLPGSAPEPVIERLDRLLERFGGLGAIARADQTSNWFLMNELEELKAFSTVLPTIFLAVAAFLSNMVLARLVAVETHEIGLLKAFGYRRWEVAWYYAKLAMAMAAVGIALGWLLGAWLGRINTEMFADNFDFPLLIFRPDPAVFTAATLISLAAALLGALAAVRRAARLPPAEAMRPPAPSRYRRSALAATRLALWLDQPTRILLRQIARQPLRSALTVVGVALAVGVLIVAMQWFDSVDHMLNSHFHDAQHQDLTVGLNEPRATTVIYDFKHLPGVLAAEPRRIIAAVLRAGPRSHRGALTGVRSDARLQTIYDVRGRTVRVPPAGLVLGTELAKKLGVGIGDTVWVEILEGRRPQRRIPVVELFETYIDLPAYINLAALNDLLRERPSAGFVDLLVDPVQQQALFAELKKLPAVASLTLRQAAVDIFNETVTKILLTFTYFFTAFAGALTFGVVYNSARISLSERGRELASLRVLGFSSTAISYILLGEVALLILLALPLGCLAGWGLAWFLTSHAFQTELFRLPLAIAASTYANAVLIVLAAALASAALVRRRLNRLDLISVLKTRE